LLQTKTKVQFDRAVTERSKPLFRFQSSPNPRQFSALSRLPILLFGQQPDRACSRRMPDCRWLFCQRTQNLHPPGRLSSHSISYFVRLCQRPSIAPVAVQFEFFRLVAKAPRAVIFAQGIMASLLNVILKGVGEPALSGPHSRPILAGMGRSAGE
jgi:hypothetical protein